jgi:hypothetical protein
VVRNIRRYVILSNFEKKMRLVTKEIECYVLKPKYLQDPEQEVDTGDRHRPC